MIEMFWIGQPPLKETGLNRGQRRFARNLAFSNGQFAERSGNFRKFSDCLAFEHLPGRQLNAFLSRAGNHLDAEDGIAAKLKEVVMDSNLRYSNQVCPDPAQNTLEWAARRAVLLFIQHNFGKRQRSAVNFSTGAKRQPLHLPERN